MMIPNKLAAFAAVTLLAALHAPTRAHAQSPSLKGVVLVANQQAASASIIDLATNTVTTIPVGDGPHEAAISHDGRTGAISIYGTQPAGNKIAIIDLKTATVKQTIDLGTYRRPHGMTFLPGDDKLVATSEASSNIVIVDLKTGTVEQAVPTNARGSHMLAVPTNAKTLWTANVGDGGITEIDLATKAFVKTYPIGTQTEGIAVTPDGSQVWVGSNNGDAVYVFDTKTKSVVAKITGVGMPYRLGISPDAKTALVANPRGSAMNVVDAKTYQITASITLDGAPEGIAFSPDSKHAFITLNEGNAVALIDIAARKEIKRFAVGTAPDGVAYTTVPRQ